jgi:hypothetical protein
MGHAVAQLVEELRYAYKPEGRRFESQLKSFRPPYGPGVDSAFTSNE